MDIRTFLIINCLCLELFNSFVSSTKVELKTDVAGIGENEGVPINTGDVIMKEDAQEVFYSVDFDKYEGVKCPPPQAPDNGIIVGEGNEVGSVVYVQCKDGYYLSGPTVMACTPVDGMVKWDPDVDRECTKGETFFQESQDLEKEQQESVEQHDSEEDDATESFGQHDIEEDEEDPRPPPHFPTNNDRHSYHVPSRWEQHREELKATWPLDEVRRRVELEDLVPSMCHLKPEKGPCKASFQRFYFDDSAMECAEFFYGGCEGNGNNFETMADCNRACLRKLP